MCKAEIETDAEYQGHGGGGRERAKMNREFGIDIYTTMYKADDY